MSARHVEAASPVWRQVVQKAAQEAATAETETWWGDRVNFNYRWEHVQAVVRLAVRLAELTGADRDVVEAAAWLHDVARRYSRDHGRDGAVDARRILTETDFPMHKVEAVAEAIVKHVGLSTDAPVEPLEAAVVWDADKLSKLGATAVLHFVGARLSKEQIVTSQLIEWLSDADWQEGVVHSLNTAPAQATGHKRLETYRAFCQQVIQEFDGRDLIAD